MRRYLIVMLLLTFSQGPTFGIELSEEAEIKVMTIGPSQRELYSAFGHSAFIVYDPVNRISNAYNYGIYDFNQPNFYLNFTKGRPVYKLGVWEYRRMRQIYMSENRSIIEQTLNLTQEEKQQLFDFLEENRKPENQDYVYNYVYDNCATKMRDVINDVLGESIEYDYSYADQGLTLRDLMDLYLGQQPWGDLGIDICLGIQIDKTASGTEYMFLPDYVQIALEQATIKRDSVQMPLVLKTETVYKAQEEANASSSVTPMMVTIGLFFILGFLTHRGLKYDIKYRKLDFVWLAVTGITGLLLLMLWLATDHLSKFNWNLFWAMPLNLPMVFFLSRKAIKPFVKYYFLLMAMIQVLLIIFHGILPQALHLALIPIMLALAIRSLYLFFDLNRQEKGERYIVG